MKKIVIFIFVFLLIITSFSAEFSIFFTNDTHGRVLAAKDRNEMKGGAAYLSSLYKKLKEKNKDNILVDAGDIFDGAYINDNFKGEPQIKVMNAMGYDIYVPGNHDFSFGLDVLKDYTEKASFQTLCTNLVDNSTYSSYFKPYIIKDILGLKVGFIGLILEKTKNTFDYKIKKKIDILDPL
ncbi:MAG: hypothetical protein C0601_12615, partial [Candidatus Muiribacterium halophilum]